MCGTKVRTCRFDSVVRLPRTMHVTYPDEHRHGNHGGTATVSWWPQPMTSAGLRHLQMDSRTNGVDSGPGRWPALSRRKIASALLEQTIRWARLHDLNHLTLEMQTKNHPAICFARKHGFSFCGFNDHYYMNRDIALFFGKSL